jgi:UDPglucose 6-dehydrogenase
MKISVVGTGYVGLVTGVCFAEMGNNVECIDIDQSKVEKMKKGECPIYEPGLEPMMLRNIEAERLSFSTGFESLKQAKVVFLAVGTPSRDDGSAELKYLYSALDDILAHAHDGLIIVLKSTVPVGTSTQVKKYILDKTDKKIIVVNNPEFLKEGAAVNDFMKPERVVIGTDDDKTYDLMYALYEPFFRLSNRTIRMSNLSAEMTKYAANCFLATKISFMNEIAKLCDRTGADVTEVRTGISTDSRIGSQFLYPGPGYGGSCFPKDVKALLKTAKDHDLELEIVSSAESVNAKQKLYIVEKINKHFNQQLSGKTFTIWGTAFKANTDDIRETAAIYVVQALQAQGAKVKFFDPIADENFDQYCKEHQLEANLEKNKYDALNDSNGLIVLTEWKEFRSPDFHEMKTRLKDHVIFDARNLYNTKQVKEEGLDYYAIGKRI